MWLACATQPSEQESSVYIRRRYSVATLAELILGRVAIIIKRKKLNKMRTKSDHSPESRFLLRCNLYCDKSWRHSKKWMIEPTDSNNSRYFDPLLTNRNRECQSPGLMQFRTSLHIPGPKNDGWTPVELRYLWKSRTSALSVDASKRSRDNIAAILT
jgi:hypothetical protein